MTKNLFQEELIDHFKFPRNKKSIKNPSFSAGEYNPSCGDQVKIEGIIKNDLISDIGFAGKGCILSQAAASMLTEKCLGKPYDDVRKISKDDILELVGLPLGPNRLRCALLSLEVLHRGLDEYKT